MKVESFTTTIEGENIQGVIHFPEQDTAPCVICSHGLFSSKESPKFIAIAEDLAREGFIAIRYDHRGCGESDGRIEDTTVSGRLKDLKAVCAFARTHPRVNGDIGLLGSSMGGFISLITAARDPSLKALSVWATPYTLRRVRSDIEEEPYPHLSDGFYEDLARHRLLDLLGRIKQCLVLHGENDELVPLWHAEKIYELMDEPKRLEIFPGGDHRFTRESDRKRAIQLSAEWFKKYLIR
nr:alpha/beta fold hydrolase [Desulfobacterales bacterium]